MLIEGLYSVLKREYQEPTFKAKVKLHKEHDVFKGHFPENPIMPGVCMIQMIKELTEEAIGKKLFLSVASNVKFMAKISPLENETIDLSLTIIEANDTVKVKSITLLEETVALKLSATFNYIN